MSYRNVSQRLSVGRIAAYLAIACAVALAPTTAGAGSGATPQSGTLANESAELRNVPYVPGDNPCDERGWHLIMNGVTPATAGNGDFGSVLLTFSDGTTGTATFDRITAGGVAMWYFQPASGTASQTLTSGTTTFPGGSGVTEFNQFVISNPACYQNGIPPTEIPPTEIPPTEIPGTPPTNEPVPGGNPATPNPQATPSATPTAGNPTPASARPTFAG
jgi:hypothetical protein